MLELPSGLSLYLLRTFESAARHLSVTAAVELGTTQPPGSGMLRFDNYTLLIQAAIAGQSVAIGWRHLVDDLLDQNLLVRVLDTSVSSDLGYYLVQPQRKRRARLMKCFVHWLQQELGDEARQAQLIQHRERIAI